MHLVYKKAERRCSESRPLSFGDRPRLPQPSTLEHPQHVAGSDGFQMLSQGAGMGFTTPLAGSAVSLVQDGRGWNQVPGCSRLSLGLSSLTGAGERLVSALEQSQRLKRVGVHVGSHALCGTFPPQNVLRQALDTCFCCCFFLTGPALELLA